MLSWGGIRFFHAWPIPPICATDYGMRRPGTAGDGAPVRLIIEVRDQGPAATATLVLPRGAALSQAHGLR